MTTVLLPQKFEDLPISPEDLVRLGLVVPENQDNISRMPYYYIADRFDPQMVPCWQFRLNPQLIYHPGNELATIRENGVLTSKWLDEATRLITNDHNEVLVRWIQHQDKGAFILRFFDWTSPQDQKIMEI